jgi:hypothetical protein
MFGTHTCMRAYVNAYNIYIYDVQRACDDDILFVLTHLEGPMQPKMSNIFCLYS